MVLCTNYPQERHGTTVSVGIFTAVYLFINLRTFTPPNIYFYQPIITKLFSTKNTLLKFNGFWMIELWYWMAQCVTKIRFRFHNVNVPWRTFSWTAMSVIRYLILYNVNIFQNFDIFAFFYCNFVLELVAYYLVTSK